VIDLVVYKNGKPLGGIEVKMGNSRYRPAQRAKDFYLWFFEDLRVNVVRVPRNWK
jgi:hypothetical protein